MRNRQIFQLYIETNSKHKPHTFNVFTTHISLENSISRESEDVTYPEVRSHLYTRDLCFR